MDDLGLVKTIDRFSENVVIEISNTPDRRLDARFRQPLGIANGHIWRSAVGMVNQSSTVDGPPIMKRLVEGIENETRMGRPACSPTDDAASTTLPLKPGCGSGAVVLSWSLLFPASKPKSGRYSTYPSCADFPSHLCARALKGSRKASRVMTRWAP